MGGASSQNRSRNIHQRKYVIQLGRNSPSDYEFTLVLCSLILNAENMSKILLWSILCHCEAKMIINDDE